MKKARIILSCIAVVTIIGGAFAFKAMTSQGFAYKFAGASTWTSTTLGATVYSTTIPLCTTTSIAGLPAYLTTNPLAIATVNVYKTTLANTVFTTTTAVNGPTVSTTLAIPVCATASPIANTFITTAL